MRITVQFELNLKGFIKEAMNKGTEKNEAGRFFDFSEVWGYYFRKKDPNNKPSINLRLMHGINKIAIVMFLGAVIYIIIKRAFL